MKQYTSCADPTESAARKERLKQAEEQGQLQESAAQLALATIATQAIDAPTVRESLSAERIPATLRLGPPQPVPDQERSPSTTKRKPGRPPGRKQTAGSPLMGIGASSRKRKTQQTKAPLARRKLNPETGTSARVPTSNRRKPASSKDTKAASGGHSSDSQPICNLIPAIKRKKKKDFHNPSDRVLSHCKMELSRAGESRDSLTVTGNQKTDLPGYTVLIRN